MFQWLVTDPLKLVNISELIAVIKNLKQGLMNVIINRGALELLGVDLFSSLP